MHRPHLLYEKRADCLVFLCFPSLLVIVPLWYRPLESASGVVLQKLSNLWKTPVGFIGMLCFHSLIQTSVHGYNRCTKRFKFLSYPPSVHTQTVIRTPALFCSTTVKFQKPDLGVSGLRRTETGPGCEKQPQWINTLIEEQYSRPQR